MVQGARLKFEYLRMRGFEPHRLQSMPDWRNWTARKTSKPVATKALSGESNLEVGGSSPPSGEKANQRLAKIVFIQQISHFKQTKEDSTTNQLWPSGLRRRT